MADKLNLGASFEKFKNNLMLDANTDNQPSQHAEKPDYLKEIIKKSSKNPDQTEASISFVSEVTGAIMKSSRERN